MTALRLVADDLTGALDAAAAFAAPDRPVAVLRDAAAAQRCNGAWALDVATREAGIDQARATAERVGPLLRDGAPAFRKIDSMLRGHVAEEIAAMARAGGFASVVIAPAFPAQGRVTRQGRQHARRADGAWTAVDVDLAAQLSQLGLAVAPQVAGAGQGAFLCDAETDSDLRAIVVFGRRLAAPVLWCGSAGLARAVAGDGGPTCGAPAGPILGVIGSRHPAAHAEIDRLRSRQPHIVRLIAAREGIADTVDGAARLLRAGQSMLLALRLPELAPSAAADALRVLSEACAALLPSSLFASGGDTLAALVQAVGAERLDCLGEITPGVPLSRMAGGSWNDVAVVSKSGGFAGGDTLSMLFDHDMEKKRAQA
jgi:D-threonate/D-erythronate kinase